MKGKRHKIPPFGAAQTDTVITAVATRLRVWFPGKYVVLDDDRMLVASAYFGNHSARQ